MERETGIGPATNSLEGCDSTTELLPPCSCPLPHPTFPIRTPLVLRVYRMLVAREGLEPSKPLGRQIYSLLRLTASLPRQLCVYVLETRCFPERIAVDGAGEGIRTPDLLITNQLLYRPELRQHKT